MIGWLANPANAIMVGALGLIVGVVSLAATLIGFTVTVVQIAKTKSASQAAEAAANDVKSRVASFDAIFEVSRAASALRETQRHLRNSAWASAVDSYSTVREALVRLTELSPAIDLLDKEAIQGMLADINSLCRRIEAGLQRGTPTVPTSALSNAREYGEIIERVSIRLQRDTL